MTKQTLEYFGDLPFKRFLERYPCPTEFHEIRMRLPEEIASPDLTVSPVKDIDDPLESDLADECHSPTKRR